MSAGSPKLTGSKMESTIFCTSVKVGGVLFAPAQLARPSASRSTMTTVQDRCADSFVLSATRSLATSGTTQKHSEGVQNILTTPALDSKCKHHWLVSQPRLAFSRPHLHGDMLEVTDQVCKLCGSERLNVLVIQTESMNHGFLREED